MHPKKHNPRLIVLLSALSLTFSCLAVTPSPTTISASPLPVQKALTENALLSLAKKIPAYGENTFVFSPKLHEWAAYDKYGYEVAGGTANGGADQCVETDGSCRTPVGQFRVTRKRGVECESSQFPVGEGGSPMPYCTFFKNGNAIHGSPYVSQNNSSHGCVRVLTPAARWLTLYFLKIHTKVVVLPYT